MYVEDLIQVEIEQRIHQVRKVDERALKCVSSSAVLFVVVDF